MRRRAVLVAVAAAAFAAVAPALPAAAATYYVSPVGSDGAAGTSPETAWRSVGRVNAAALAPGDSVLFRAGATFGDSTLMPAHSGAPGKPIVYGSYGGGRATIANAQGAVWFSGRTRLVFDHLKLTSAGSSTTVFAGSPGGGSSYITISKSLVTDTRGIGIVAPNPLDSHWTIRDSTIAHVGDSGLVLLGSEHVVTHNTISDTGWNPAITWGKHGVYSKGADQTISYNDFSRNANGQSVSIRFHGARVFGNTIHDTGEAFAFYDYDPAPAPQGTSTIYGNRGWNISRWVFYYDDYRDPNGRLPSVDFVLRDNHFHIAGKDAEAVDVKPSGSAKVTLLRNVFTGSYGSGLVRAPSTVAIGNVFSGALFNTA